MATAKYIARINGANKEVIPAVTTAADSIVATGADGKLDISLMPVGVGAEVRVVTSFENLTAGEFVNIFLDGGVAKARKADATTNGKPADGFVLANVVAPANATVYGLSNMNTQLAGLTIGTVYYLSTTPGAVVASPGPTGAGNLNQPLGKAHLTTALVFDGPTSAAVEMT